ncbi:MAG: helix-turn-helix domain-containing protein [Gemmatimonadetes bacterium]|nr:helix-turn-helix domain-containing protein [Gemmatimonadota bacterium]
MKMHDYQKRIGIRLKAARERAGLTQQQLAEALGLEHRQTLASIEAGDRRLAADELIRAVAVLRTDLDYFTDSFRLVGEGRFSFRAHADVAPNVLDQFEDRAGRWIATYRELSAREGDEPQWLEQKLALSPRSTFEEAQAAGESLVEQWQLGERPAESLQRAMEDQLRALVLYVDAPTSISGAASQVPGLSAVLVNRFEPEGRRHYDLAHELFHLLTWDVMPPERLETADVPRGGKGKRVEQLAENFAAAVLMPAAGLRERWESRDTSTDLHDWLNATAEDLRVSALACKWRCYNLGWLSKADLLDINDQRLVASGRAQDALPPIHRFSERFVRRIAGGMEAGRLSVKRAASLLGLSLVELATLLQDHAIEPLFEA